MHFQLYGKTIKTFKDLSKNLTLKIFLKIKDEIFKKNLRKFLLKNLLRFKLILK
jgi:hypothetical protein